MVNDGPDGRSQRHTAGIFDIRNVIGALLGIYGVILLLVGIVGGSSNEHVSDGAGNVWVGVGLLVACAFFLVWTRLRPTVVDERELEEEKEKAADERDGPGPG